MADEDNDLEDAIALGCTARLEIRWVAKMSETQRMNVAEWLREKAAQVLAEGHTYAPIVTMMLDPDKGTED